jgi:uncharacterized SAM-binding protein YcdF (DUF218 family)
MSGAPPAAERRRALARRILSPSLARAGALTTLGLIAVCVAVGRWLFFPSDQQRADAIVVLGGGHPTRVEQGIALYQRGLAPELWHTGDVPPPGAKLSQADRAATMAVERGLPPDAIYLLATSSTWEDGQAIAALARERGAGRLLVVTDWTHSRRAICTIRQAADPSVEVSYAPPPLAEYGPGTWWLSPSGIWALRRELPAIMFYWLQYDINPFGC